MLSQCAPYPYSPEERPIFPGSPYSPRHTRRRRAIYALSALVMAMASGLGNGMITANMPVLAGEMGLYVAEANILLAVYVAFNATANLLLVKARQQFGIPATMHVVLGALMAAQAIQLAAPGFATAVLARAISGLAAGGLTTLSLYSIFQVFPLNMRPVAAVVGFSLPQLASPLARLFPLDAIGPDGWHGLHLVELAMALGAWAMLNLVPLPPVEREKVFEPLDALSTALFISGMLLVGGALAVGRYGWWTETPWLGWSLAGGIPLLGLALVIEDRRARPLLRVRWYGSAEILFFTIVAILIRLALGEQTYAAIGLLSLGGQTSDQLHGLFGVVFLAMAGGIATVALTLRVERIVPMIMVAALVIALGALLDSQANSLTRAPQLYLSQALIGFGTTLFLGPALLLGIGHIMRQGAQYLVSFVVLFSTTQNLGGLAGSALLGSIQTMRERIHAEYLAEALFRGDPQVIARAQAYAQTIAAQIPDPAARSTQANALFGQALHAQANVLAYNDTFLVIACLALATGAYVAIVAIRSRMAAAAPKGNQP